ncbi:hypothetical protein COW99_01730 [Candidatus Roizmanbacteria bacterium CG22_combo_CG10-13_8_21_14_all_38_20]|uniref:DUF86 domain-containing protein n=1 Tax=Candidatus Roizmanbacteria bacterium CG22_combo_CG10-13_8_21_14_all_38_20 TaxID=1974862 RepID=A0A2H0BW72_9BACT|nr:DUF86 domain-containing protein [Candidatus Microgenomates bacterium]PIP61925.1 MAG: hypothetical protein COW99_01730 [Candidatus Roizmanbacteria bacterium CG22_combo_CG10-13_8_21_14_all_38_20]PJC32100.1 MAG: hypothetical protein CO050_01225 [Candidatus Roizmanbacteria bacterium CG_4_9_14_0_2_um_filter_38_17]
MKIATPYIENILDSIVQIEKYLTEIKYDKKSFLENIEKQDAVIRRLEVIGEATKRLEEDYKSQFPNVPWKNMAGMRDVLIHDYDEVDIDLVWDTVSKDLVVLKEAIK